MRSISHCKKQRGGDFNLKILLPIVKTSHKYSSQAFASTPSYSPLLPTFSHGAKAFFTFRNGALKSGKWRHRTSFIGLVCAHANPSWVYISDFQSVAMKRSRLAMRMKTREAVLLKPKPLGRGSQRQPTRRSTVSMPSG
jgi:hypothetical protein